MSSDSSLIDELYSFLVSEKRVAYFNSSRSELTTRCPYCGDSVKNSNHGHMYIAAHAPFSFYCQRCETKGFLNFDTLREFEVSEPELAMQLVKAAKSAIRNTTKTTGDINSLITGTRQLIIPEYNENSKIFNRKLDYLEGRWGCELSIEDLTSLKMIPQFDDFIALNKLKGLEQFYAKSEYHTNLRKWLKLYSVGFLSTDTNYVTFRHTKIPGDGRRYYTESNNRPLNIGHRLYTIGNEIDVMTPELNLILAEGVMDIGSIWINQYDKLRAKDTIFGAVNGRAYKLFINTMRRMGFFRINLEVYSDREINLNTYKYGLNLNHFKSVKVHYNEFSNEKDFGVPNDRIKKRTYRLK